jgi:outer membrane protein OmpA-like peptidoglycan-associated protein
MIGNVLRFRVKRTLFGIAALSLLLPVASHADVTPGRWIFDGFSRSTRDGNGTTCVGSGGDTHAFEAPSCNEAAVETKAAAEATAKARKAAKDAAATKRAAAAAEAREFVPGGQKDFRVRRNDGIKLVDGFGRDCVRNGSTVSSTTGNCADPSPQSSRGVDSIIAARSAAEKEARASKAAAAAAATALPMIPGAALADGQNGAYVYRPAGSNVRDGYGRSCIKDGLWHPALATEECHPDLYNQWAANSVRPEPELLKRIEMPPPEVQRIVETNAAPAPAKESAPAPASPAPVAVDYSPAVFPITTYSIDDDSATLPTVAALAATAEMADGDEDEEVIAEAEEAAEDSDEMPPVFAAEPDDTPDSDAMVAAVEDEDEDALPDDPEEEDDDTMPFLAGDMRDEDDTVLTLDDDDTLAGDDDGLLDEDDVPVAALLAPGIDDDEEDDSVAADDLEDDTETAYLGDGDDGVVDADDVPVAALLAPGIEDDDEDDSVAADDLEDDTETAYLGDSDVVEASDAPLVAIVADDDEDPVFAINDDDDDPVFATGDETDSTETASLAEPTEASDVPMVAMVGEEDEAVLAMDEADDDSAPPVFAEEPASPEPTPAIVVADTAPRTTSAPAPAPVEQKPAEFPVTSYEFDGAAEAQPAPAAPEAIVAPVVNEECPPTTIQMEEGRFAFDRFSLRPEVISKLDAIADLLKTAKCDAILITGHTDRIGTSKYNKRLSERRAAAAKSYLVDQKGIDPQLVTVTGVGKNEPVTTVADCKGKRKKALIACYAPDRRVVITATLRKPAN